MKVTAQGYSRNYGTRTILDEELVDAVIEEDGASSHHKRNTLYLKKRKRDGGISMKIGPCRLRGFGGYYDLSVDLSEAEITKLFLECFPQLRDTIARLTPAPAAQTAEGASSSA
jgi:hypothetical protein